MNRTLPLALCAGLALVAGACGTLQNDLVQAEGAYEEARYDDAEVWLADIGQDVAKLDREHRARFFYVRGMTAYRLGRRNDALHYLALAREESGESEAASHLTAEKRQIMDRTLAELTPHTATHRANEAGAEEEEESSDGEAGGADDGAEASPQG
ncbi:MAG: hypothetical protein GWN84_26710, partial [Gammaproteobacteria bacterium]|nr:hypothetical protein [Gammaproteobacteria bacterium]NIR85989.1 hypothetical protein [Gammaproteobacteria bacterium]NIU07230.1 hypothetical protein [Gammaproteobacteria bacterium]NIV54033.1 hypothetical protein [Gammaproteobacteria bacterium]NIX88503.1 hypothetical protein [Gammaproteobacteria bacterium]